MTWRRWRARRGTALGPGDTRRNLLTRGIHLPALVGGWFAVGPTLLFGLKRCPPCTHLERLTGVRLVKTMVHRGRISAAERGAPTGNGRPVPRQL
jgi:MOSC domain-containing protein YiiM